MDTPIQEEVVETSGQTETPAEVQPEETLPISEQKPSEPSGELPEAVTERTKFEFNKLKEANRRLKEELETKSSNTKEYGKSVLDGMFGQPQPSQQPVRQPEFGNLSQQQVNNIANQFVDEAGYVDTAKLNAALMDANRKAERATEEARQTRALFRQQEEKRQSAEAHKVFPQIDPNSGQFDPQAFKLVRNAVFASLMEGNEPPELIDIAKDVLSSYKTPSNESEVKEQAVAEFKEKQVVKAQASAVQSGKGQPREEFTRNEELRERTRRGDESALDERIKNI